MEIVFSAPIWIYSGKGSWHFVTLTPEAADQVRFLRGRPHGFGTVRVKATIGESTWATSLFPDSKSSSFVLPIKADIRRQEGLKEAQQVEVRLVMDM
jgi:hypothetical protein